MGYLKSKQFNSILNNLSIESNSSKPNKRTISNAGVILKGSNIQKLIGHKKSANLKSKKKRARSKTKTEKSVVFVMPGQQIANQFIHYCK